MLTKDQALTENEFHADCTLTIGPRGGKTYKGFVYRRNGQTQTWKTRPNEFRIPVKRGMYDYGQITQDDASYFTTRSECPVCGKQNDSGSDCFPYDMAASRGI